MKQNRHLNSWGKSGDSQKNHHKPEHQGRLIGRLKKIKIKGFKSIENVELPLKNINILIGANGVGKSNFLGFFEMLSWMIKGNNLQEYISRKGGADDLLFNGAKATRSIESYLEFSSKTGKTEYQFTLQHTEDNALAFSREEYRFTPTKADKKPSWKPLGMGHREAKLTDKRHQDKTGMIVSRMLKNCSIYQFHDTSRTSPFSQPSSIDDNVFLKTNGYNVASVLYDLQQNSSTTYKSIVDVIRKALPVFSDFQLEPLYKKITLKWTQKNNDKLFPPHLSSDGSLRFFALATLLSMPKDRTSDIVLLDEPELGVHPYVITILSSLIKRLSKRNKQVIVATQSPLLINQFDAEDVIVAEMRGGGTNLERLDNNDLRHWLDDYCLGDLWQKNVFGGNPE